MDVLLSHRPSYMMKQSAAIAHEPSLPVSCGTTLIACEYADGVIIGADSRTSMGQYISNRVSDKLTQVTERIYCCRSGSSADTQAITDIVKYRLSVIEQFEKKPATVHRTAQVFRQYCYEYRDQMSASVLVAGWDDVEGAQVYAIPIGGFVIRQRNACSGSGSTFVQGFIDSQWKPKMTQEEAEKFVKSAVTLAMLRDGSSGGVCRMGILTKDGLERKVFSMDKGTLPKMNDLDFYSDIQ